MGIDEGWEGCGQGERALRLFLGNAPRSAREPVARARFRTRGRTCRPPVTKLVRLLLVIYAGCHGATAQASTARSTTPPATLSLMPRSFRTWAAWSSTATASRSGWAGIKTGEWFSRRGPTPAHQCTRPCRTRPCQSGTHDRAAHCAPAPHVGARTVAPRHWMLPRLGPGLPQRDPCVRACARGIGYAQVCVRREDGHPNQLRRRRPQARGVWV